MRVLLIEDDMTTSRSIELMLSAEGFNVYATDLGEEGLDLGKLYDYDIILLDLNLPDMHGYDVLKKLRVAFQLKDVDMHAIFAAAGFPLSKPELSALFRQPDHKNYRACGDQLLRNFLKGLTARLRGA